MGGSSNALVQVVSELCLCVEEMYKEGRNIGAPEKFFLLMERNSDSLPVGYQEVILVAVLVLTLVTLSTGAVCPDSDGVQS